MARPGNPAQDGTAVEPTVVVAAFDFDGTLTQGGSVWPFLRAVVGWPRLARAALAVAPQLLVAAVLGGRWADRAKQALFVRTLQGRRVDEVTAVADTFGRAHMADHARPDMLDRVARHRAAGHRIVIVSASPELYLRPAAAALGADGLVATRLAVDASGRLTGRYEDGNCRGPAKLARLDAWTQDHLARTTPSGPPPRVVRWAYGNSAGDREMLAGADIGVDVGRLSRFGRLRRFPRLAQAPDPLTTRGQHAVPVVARPEPPDPTPLDPSVPT
jgi:phosphatidylglycerophosphatase C